MILVTGATGQYGSKAIEHLLKKGVDPSEISALVRDEKKASILKELGIKIKVGDYTAHYSLLRAFENVDTLLLVSSNDRSAVENRTKQHISAIKAASKTRVGHIVYTSFARKPDYRDSILSEFQDSHVQTEGFLKESGIDYTILQNGIYMEMIPPFVGEKVVETGAIVFPAKNGCASWVLREELAEAAAHVLTTEGHKNKTYTLTNPEAKGFEEIASEMTTVLGKKITYESPDTDRFGSMLKNAGVPDMLIGMLSLWAGAVAQNRLDLRDDTLQSFLGRKPKNLSSFIKKTYG